MVNASPARVLTPAKTRAATMNHVACTSRDESSSGSTRTHSAYCSPLCGALWDRIRPDISSQNLAENCINTIRFFSCGSHKRVCHCQHLRSVVLRAVSRGSARPLSKRLRERQRRGHCGAVSGVVAPDHGKPVAYPFDNAHTAARSNAHRNAGVFVEARAEVDLACRAERTVRHAAVQFVSQPGHGVKLFPRPRGSRRLQKPGG